MSVANADTGGPHKRLLPAKDRGAPRTDHSANTIITVIITRQIPSSLVKYYHHDLIIDNF